MQDRPTSQEFLRGISRFLESEVVPVLSEPLRFHTRVAANLLKIIDRELDLEQEHLLKEAEALRTLLSLPAANFGTSTDLRQEVRGLNETLCRRIRQGEADQPPWGKKVQQFLKESVIRKLEIANPPMIEKGLIKY